MGAVTTHDIPLVRLDWRGNVTTILSSNYGPDHKLVHRQLQAQARALPISISLIVQKLKNCIATLESLPSNERVKTAIGRISADVKELIRAPPKSLKMLRGIEEQASLAGDIKAFSELSNAVLDVSRHITTLFSYLISDILVEYVPEPEVKIEKFENSPKLSEFALPYFFDEDEDDWTQQYQQAKTEKPDAI